MSERDTSAQGSAWVGGQARLVAVLLLLGGAAFYPVVVVVQQGWRRLRQRRADVAYRRRQQARLGARLGEEGVAELAPGDARRVEAEQRFWREEQARAVSALRERFVREPAPLPLRAALAERVRHHRTPLRVVGVGLCLVLVLGGGLVIVSRNASIFVILACMAVALFCGSASVMAIGVEGVMIAQRRAEQRRIFTAERRRITEMAELAGGLTLVAPIGDDALIGALSGEVSQGGELEQVEGR
jgi:hypothetical protein